MELLSKIKLHKKVLNSYIQLFNTDDGRIVLRDLCAAHHIRSTTFSKDPLEMALREGERNVVLRILTFLNIGEHELSELTKMEEGE